MSVYSCKYCGNIVESDNTPKTSGCTADGHSYHHWSKICKNCSIEPQAGLKPYICKYCHNVVYSESSPSSSTCSKHSNHHWSSVGNKLKYSDLDKLKNL